MKLKATLKSRMRKDCAGPLLRQPTKIGKRVPAGHLLVRSGRCRSSSRLLSDGTTRFLR